MCCDKISMNFTNARKAQPVIIYEDSVGTTQVTIRPTFTRKNPGWQPPDEVSILRNTIGCSSVSLSITTLKSHYMKKKLLYKMTRIMKKN